MGLPMTMVEVTLDELKSQFPPPDIIEAWRTGRDAEWPPEPPGGGGGAGGGGGGGGQPPMVISRMAQEAFQRILANSVTELGALTSAQDKFGLCERLIDFFEVGRERVPARLSCPCRGQLAQ